MMNRNENAINYMDKKNITENSLQTAFPEFETIKNNLLYGEVRQETIITDTMKMLVSISALITMEGADLKSECKSALAQGMY